MQRFWKFATPAALLLAIGLTLMPMTQAQTYNVLYNFVGPTDGTTPLGGLTLDAAGNLYGTTLAGGGAGFGTVYRLAHTSLGWSFYTLYNFQGYTQFSIDGGAPYSGVTFGPDGALYGTTHIGGNGQGCRAEHGCGTVYRLQPWPRQMDNRWQETVLYQFGTNDGMSPLYGNVVFDRAGNLYGSTRKGGDFYNGAIYELSPSNGVWTGSVVHSFSGLDGSTPLNGPAIDEAGNLYFRRPSSARLVQSCTDDSPPPFQAF